MNYKIQFEELEWIEPEEGIRFKIFVQNNEQVRLIEIKKEFTHSEWCLNGHIAYMIEGEMEVEFDEVIETYKKGDVLFIPNGEEHRHRPKAITSVVKFVAVEKV